MNRRYRFVLVVAMLVTSPWVFAARRSREKPKTPDEVFHEAVGWWIEGKGEQARDACLAVAKELRTVPMDVDRFENARILNLLAWIERDLGTPDPGDLSGTRDLRTAETFAARAAFESPLDLRYWRDFIQIAEERRQKEFPKELAEHGKFVYRARGKFKEVTLLEKDGERVVAEALAAELRGDVLRAETTLTKFLSRKENHDACLPRIALAEIQFAGDRFASARRTIEAVPERCKGSISVLRLKSLLYASSGIEGSARDALVAWQHAEQHAWERLPFQASSSEKDATELHQQHSRELQFAVLRDPLRSETWSTLWRLTTTRPEPLEREYSRVLSAITRMTGLSRHPTIRMAAAYPYIHAGDLESARKIVSEVVVAQPHDGRSVALMVLLSAALHERGPEIDAMIERLPAIAPELASYIDTKLASTCLVDATCEPGVIVYKSPPDLLQWFDVGLSKRPDLARWIPTLKKELGRATTKLERLMAESEKRTLNLITANAARQARFERNVNAMVTVLRRELGNERKARRELDGRMQEVEKRSHALESQMGGLATYLDQVATNAAGAAAKASEVATQAHATHQQVSRLALRLAVDEEVLHNLRPEFEERYQLSEAFRKALEELGYRVNQLAATVSRKLPTELEKAIAVFKNFRTASLRDKWEATVTLANRIGSLNLGFNLGVLQAQVNVITTLDTVVDVFLGDKTLPDLTAGAA